MTEHLVLRVVAKLLLPLILLFSLYVQFHGDFGPGGGFQAGVIFAAGFILYALIFGVRQGRRVLPGWLTHSLVAVGLLIYAGTGLATMALGGNFLDYNVLAHDPAHGQELGIMLIEFGVGITVSNAMIIIIYMFAGRGEHDGEPDRE
ncbi:MAG TPA: Na(+)/H(+) antiporter subunit B [Gammaproteobacteria bacterium]|nr:Na(+)/H(+) antiporter subunit B [Gammaproteobacteria bacterium]